MLLVVGLTAAFSSYSTIGTQLNHSVRRSTAGAIAEATLEELVLRFPADPALTLGAHTDAPRFYDDSGARVASGGLFTVTWTVSPYAKVKSIREVTVHVGWTDISGPSALEVTTWRN